MRYDNSTTLEQLEELLTKVRKEGLQKVSKELQVLFHGFLSCPYISVASVRNYDVVMGDNFADTLPDGSMLEVPFEKLQEEKNKFLSQHSPYVEESTVELHVSVSNTYSYGEINLGEFEFHMHWKGLRLRSPAEVDKDREAFEKANKRRSIVQALWDYYKDDIRRLDQEKTTDPDYQKYLELRARYEKGGRG